MNKFSTCHVEVDLSGEPVFQAGVDNVKELLNYRAAFVRDVKINTNIYKMYIQ